MLALVGAIVALAPASASATHFRSGTLNWQKAGPTVAGATPVTFQSELSFRRSFFGNLQVGDVVENPEGCIDFGDGSSACPRYRVASIDTAEDAAVLHAVAPGSDSDRNVPHTYTGPGPFTATTSGCCALVPLANAADTYWQLSSFVNLVRDDESPKVTVPPVVQVAAGGEQRFTVPASDAGGETLRFRLATAQESCRECPDPHPPGLSIDPVSGRVTWDTSGRAAGLWRTAVVVEAVVAGEVVSSTQSDYLIRVVAPTAARTAVAQVVSGDVLVRRPGASAGFVPLQGTQVIPIGSIVNAARGRVAITTSSTIRTAPNRPTQRAEFYQGSFRLRQRRARRPTTDIVLRSPNFVRLCGVRPPAGAGAGAARSGRVVAAQARRSRRIVSRLWGNGRGRFRTRGRNSAATVRGTTWLTEERCDGTLTRVTRGLVSVRDVGARRTVIVRAGRSYLARAVRATLRSSRP